MTAPLNPIRLAGEIDRLASRLEDATDELAKLTVEAAEAEVAYKRAEAEAIIHAAQMPGNGPNGRSTVDEREAHAFIACADKYAARLISAAVRDSAQEQCRTIRANLSACQTISKFVVVSEGAA